MSRTCGACQFLVESQWERCKFCGHDLAAPPAPPVLPDAPDPMAEPDAAPSGGFRLPPPSGKRVLYGIAAAVVLYAGIAFVVNGEPWTTTNSDGVEVMSGRALATVCEGDGGAKGTAEYEPGPGHHPIQVARHEDGGWRSVWPPYALSGQFEGEPASEIELVGCYRPLPNPSTTFCRFERGLNVYVEHHSVAAEVRVASTGELVDSDVITPDDESCPALLWVEDGEAEKTVLPERGIDSYMSRFADQR